MSEELNVGYHSDNHARVIREWELRTHLGKMLTFIDSLGLQEKQEKAIKDLVKQSTWGEFWNSSSTPIIRTKEANELLEKAIMKEQELSSK